MDQRVRRGRVRKVLREGQAAIGTSQERQLRCIEKGGRRVDRVGHRSVEATHERRRRRGHGRRAASSGARRWRDGGRVGVHARVLLLPFGPTVLEPDLNLRDGRCV